MTLILDPVYKFNCDYEWIFKQCKFIIIVNLCERSVVAIYRKFKVSFYSQIIKCDKL